MLAELPGWDQPDTIKGVRPVRLMAALKMFELGKISSGKAAELAGMSRAEFFEACGRYRVSPFNYADGEGEEEVKKDFETAKVMSY